VAEYDRLYGVSPALKVKVEGWNTMLELARNVRVTCVLGEESKLTSPSTEVPGYRFWEVMEGLTNT
jgi:hypothetical protein